MLATAFHFLDAPRLFTLVDHELELVEPDMRFADDLLAACHHPLTRELMPAQSKLQRDGIVTFLAQNPRGWSAPEPDRDIAPGYTFWMHVRHNAVSPPGIPGVVRLPDIVIAGSISLRIGHSLNLDCFLGHIGYHVLPPARGRHFAERAVRLLLPLARAHGHEHVWITCNPDNIPSRRTCERLGASYVDIVSVPRDNSLYTQGDRQKCRYKLRL